MFNVSQHNCPRTSCERLPPVQILFVPSLSTTTSALTCQLLNLVQMTGLQVSLHDRKAVAVVGPTCDGSQAPSVDSEAVAVIGPTSFDGSHAPRVSSKAVAVAGQPPATGHRRHELVLVPFLS